MSPEFYRGGGVYVYPSLDFVPFIYTPLYYYVSAALAWFTGIGFLPLRLVSVVATFGSLLLIYRFVWRETRHWAYGVIGAGLFAASYGAVNGWFDIARADSLLVLSLLAAVYLFRYHSSRFSLGALGALLATAFFIKQSGLFLGGALLVLTVWKYRLRSLWAVAPFGFVLGFSLLAANLVSDGWFWYYTIFVPRSHQLLTHQFVDFWIHDILRYLAPGLILLLAYLARIGRRREWDDLFFWVTSGAALFGMAWSGRLHSGGFVNVLMPAFAYFALIAPVALCKFLRGESDLSRRLRPLLLLFGVVQFALFMYLPGRFIPSDMDRITGEKILASIESVEGEVLMPFHGWYTSMAGKRSYAHKMAVGDVVRADSALGLRVEAEIDSAIAAQQFDLVILNAAWRIEALGQYYQSIGNPTGETQFFYPVTGFATRPRHWLVPK